MKSLVELRKKTGFTQQDMADYLGVSRSLLSMVEKGLRELPKEASVKLAALQKLFADAEANKKPTPEVKDDRNVKRLKDHHKQKMEDHLYKASMLQRYLAIVLKAQKKADAKLKLVNDLAKDNLQTKKSRFDNHWIGFHDAASRKKILKNTYTLQNITIDIEVQLGYAAVHEKILKGLF